MKTQHDLNQFSLPAELLSYFHYRLRFWPESSICILAMRARHGCLVPDVVARIDIADLAHRDDLSYVIDHFAWRDCTEIVIGIFDEAGSWANLPSSMEPLQQWLIEWERSGISTAQIVCLYGKEIAKIAYVEGKWQQTSKRESVERLKSSMIAAEMVLSGYSPAANRAELAAPDFGGLVNLHSEDNSSEVHGSNMPKKDDWNQIEPIWLEVQRKICDSRHLKDMQSQDRHHLLRCLSVGEMRDRILLGIFDCTISSSHELVTLAREILRPTGPAPVANILNSTISGLEGLLPYAREKEAAIIYAMLAWLFWISGDGAKADVVCQQALDLVDEQHLALLVQRALLSAMPPGWLIID